MEPQLAMTLPDPNKQAFPLLSPHHHPVMPPIMTYQSSPSPTKPPTTMAEAQALNPGGGLGKSGGAIELPQIYDGQSTGIGGDDVTNTTKDALKPSLPRVPAKQKGVSREGKSIQQAIEKVKQQSNANNAVMDEEDLVPDDLTQRIHTNHPLPYQYKNFRSSVQMKTVPITKRHRDLYSSYQDQLFPPPLSRTRVQPVHTRPFLWNQCEGGGDSNSNSKSPTTINVNVVNTSTNPEKLPDKFLAKEKHLKKMRGLKRRYSVPQHRKRFSDLHVGGQAPNFALREDYRGEMTNLRNTVVPDDIQALYTGKGFNLPPTHTIVRKREEWQNNLKAEYELPNSAPATVMLPMAPDLTDTEGSIETRSHSADEDLHTPHKSPSTNTTHSRTPPRKLKTMKKQHQPTGVDHKMLSVGLDNRTLDESGDGGGDKGGGGEVNKRAAGRGLYAKSENIKQPTTVVKQPRVPKVKAKPERKQNKNTAGVLPKLQSETPSEDDLSIDMDTMEHTPNSDSSQSRPSAEVPPISDTPEIEAPEETKNGEDSGRPESEMEIEMTPDNSNNKLRIVYSPTTPKAISPNPLKCADLALNISANRREELAGVFCKLDADKDGHISVAELLTTLPDALTRGQRTFIKEVYELVSASTFFGMDEYVTVTCLVEEMLHLAETLKAAYEEIDVSILEQLISQYVILFATVDRQQTGSISIDSLKEILTMALDKDLNLHTQLYSSILETIDKEYSSAISKVEYLSFLPFFFTCK